MTLFSDLVVIKEFYSLKRFVLLFPDTKLLFEHQRNKKILMKIEFLRNKRKEEVRVLIQGFSSDYCYDLHFFTKITEKYGTFSPQSAEALSQLLNKWTACRPSRTNKDLLPLLIDLNSDLKTISNLDLRNIRQVSLNEKEAIDRIWLKLFNRICIPKKLTGVAPSKAILILTNGRLGPALDSKTRKTLGLQDIVSSVQYLTILSAVSEDIAAFENANSPILLEELVPEEWKPVFVGRAYDMAVGPRKYFT